MVKILIAKIQQKTDAACVLPVFRKIKNQNLFNTL
jgi:hypothetical protein